MPRPSTSRADSALTPRLSAARPIAIRCRGAAAGRHGQAGAVGQHDDAGPRRLAAQRVGEAQRQLVGAVVAGATSRGQGPAAQHHVGVRGGGRHLDAGAGAGGDQRELILRSEAVGDGRQLVGGAGQAGAAAVVAGAHAGRGVEDDDDPLPAAAADGGPGQRDDREREAGQDHRQRDAMTELGAGALRGRLRIPQHPQQDRARHRLALVVEAEQVGDDDRRRQREQRQRPRLGDGHRPPPRAACTTCRRRRSSPTRIRAGTVVNAGAYRTLSSRHCASISARHRASSSA